MIAIPSIDVFVILKNGVEGKESEKPLGPDKEQSRAE